MSIIDEKLKTGNYNKVDYNPATGKVIVHDSFGEYSEEELQGQEYKLEFICNAPLRMEEAIVGMELLSFIGSNEIKRKIVKLKEQMNKIIADYSFIHMSIFGIGEIKQ